MVNIKNIDNNTVEQKLLELINQFGTLLSTKNGRG